MKVYLGGSVSAGRKFEKNLQMIAERLVSLGHEILTPFVVDKKINERRFSELPEAERAAAIYKEDIELLCTGDILVTEVSEVSHGVGVEIGLVTGINEFGGRRIPILLLKHESLKEIPTSKMITGNPYAELYYYSEETIDEILEKFFGSLQRIK